MKYSSAFKIQNIRTLINHLDLHIYIYSLFKNMFSRRSEIRNKISEQKLRLLVLKKLDLSSEYRYKHTRLRFKSQL